MRTRDKSSVAADNIKTCISQDTSHCALGDAAAEPAPAAPRKADYILIKTYISLHA